jgi:hypothetical protein
VQLLRVDLTRPTLASAPIDRSATDAFSQCPLSLDLASFARSSNGRYVRTPAVHCSGMGSGVARPLLAISLASCRPARPSAPRGGSKLARAIALLERDHGGATIEELIAATGWLAHTTRAALTGLRKRGYAVAIDRSDKQRGSFYRILAGETGLVEGPANSETARRKEQGRSEPQADQAA